EYDLAIYDFNGQTKLDLDAILDRSHKITGDNVDDKNVKALLSEFENSFLDRFEKNRHVTLKSGWFN
ncbi:MAG TPA: hypothetical protein VFE54_04645, partial [Mucilaginibacter sp.]|nr:hypothetical protein [Mucilaginibacter sp.]